MKKPVIVFLAFFFFQSFLMANDELSKDMMLLKERGTISESDLEKIKKEADRINVQIDNDELEMQAPTNFNISKEEMLKSLVLLKEQGKISEADLEKAKKELSGISNSQIESMTKTAIAIIKQDPEKIHELMTRSKLDTEEINKQIKNLPSKSK